MRTGKPEEQVTSTGWRIVGAPAVSLLSATSNLDAAPSGDPDDVVYAASFRVKARIGTNALDPLLAALDSMIAPVRTGTGVVARKTRFTDPASKFHSIVWRTATHDSLWIGELAWRRVHPAIGGIALTDHVVIEDRPGDLRLTVRTFVNGGVNALRGHVGVGQARSPLVAAAAGATRLTFNGKSAEPRVLIAGDVDAFISDVLLDEHRLFPVALLSPTEDGAYHVEPADLAAELLGTAPVFFLDEHKTSFVLTDALGDRRLSCFWGALRIYQPGFSCGDDPRSHPLEMHERLSDPVVRSGLAGALALANRSHVAPPPGIENLATPSAAASTSPAVTPAIPAATNPSRDTATPPARVGVGEPTVAPYSASLTAAHAGALDASIRMLAEQLAAFQKANVALMDEIVRLRTTAAVRAASSANVDRRLGQLERLIRDSTSPRSASPSPPAVRESGTESVVTDEAPEVSLASVVRHAMATQADALLVLEQAVASAEDSPYEDVDRVAVILDAMAYIARQRQADAMGQSLRDTFREFGINYRGGITKATSGRHLRQYVAHLPGGDVICDEHIALGTSYDPRYCLRIYFTSRAPGEPRFVIAHVGRHFDVSSTT